MPWFFILGRQQIKVICDIYHGYMQFINYWFVLWLTQTQVFHLPLPVHTLDGMQRFGLIVMTQEHRFLRYKKRKEKEMKFITNKIHECEHKDNTRSNLNFLPFVVDVLKPRKKQSAVVARPGIAILLLLLRR